MASSRINTPHLRPSSDTTSSESHPGVLAHERAGPFAISAAQICVKIGKDGQPGLPSDVVLDKRYTHSPPAVMNLRVKDGPPAPPDLHTNVFTTPPLYQKQVAMSQSPSSSSTFERRVLASVPTTNSQPVAPISAASDSTPLPGSPAAGPASTTDISTAGLPSIHYLQSPALNQSLTRSPYSDPGQSPGKTPRRSEPDESDHDPQIVKFHFNVIKSVFMWILLAGFLVLPSSFPNIQTIVADSGELSKVLRVARNTPLLVIGFACCIVGATGLCWLWWHFKYNYAWLLSSIFIPGMFGGISGLISTFVNLYGSQDGVHYGTTTIATIAATGGCAAICGFLTIIYTILRRLRDRRYNVSGGTSSNGDDSKEKLGPR